jgi:hypothetical protein
MEQIECSETSAYKIQTPGNHPEENIQHTEHGESLKSKINYMPLAVLPLWHEPQYPLKRRLNKRWN